MIKRKPFTLNVEQTKYLESMRENVIKWARMHAWSHYDPDEVESEALFAAAVAIQKYDPSKGTARRSWVLNIVKLHMWRITKKSRNFHERPDGTPRKHKRIPAPLNLHDLPRKDHPGACDPGLREVEERDEGVPSIDTFPGRVNRILARRDPVLRAILTLRMEGIVGKRAAETLGMTPEMYRSKVEHLRQVGLTALRGEF